MIYFVTVPKHCWKRSGLQAHGHPRPYDLRHAFATRNLIRWIDNGLDINHLLPYLSTYMGHSELDSTFYYIHLLPERIRKSAGINWKQFADILVQKYDFDKIPWNWYLYSDFICTYHSVCLCDGEHGGAFGASSKEWGCHSGNPRGERNQTVFKKKSDTI